MTDDALPRSRRERRELAERASQGIEDAEINENAELSAAGRPLTRAERRRLERLDNPIETWSAEEEMIVTGQIPVMTPELLAEQERLAEESRRIAEERQREAELLAAREALVAVQPVVEAPADEFVADGFTDVTPVADFAPTAPEAFAPVVDDAFSPATPEPFAPVTEFDSFAAVSDEAAAPSVPAVDTFAAPEEPVTDAVAVDAFESVVEAFEPAPVVDASDSFNDVVEADAAAEAAVEPAAVQVERQSVIPTAPSRFVDEFAAYQEQFGATASVDDAVTPADSLDNAEPAADEPSVGASLVDSLWGVPSNASPAEVDEYEPAVVEQETTAVTEVFSTQQSALIAEEFLPADDLVVEPAPHADPFVDPAAVEVNDVPDAGFWPAEEVENVADHQPIAEVAVSEPEAVVAEPFVDAGAVDAVSEIADGVEHVESVYEDFAAEEISPVAYNEPATPEEPEADAFVQAATEAVEEPETAPVHDDGIPEAFRHLFPPGSLQARGLQEQAAPVVPPSAPEAPAFPVQDAAPAASAADEFRRLTEQAIYNIEHSHDAVDEAPVSAEAFAEVVQEPAEYTNPFTEALEQSLEEPVVEEAPRNPWAEPVEVEQPAGELQWSITSPFTPVEATTGTPASAVDALESSASVWDSHPLTTLEDVPGATEIAPETVAATEIPQPDLSSLLPQERDSIFPPISGESVAGGVVAGSANGFGSFTPPSESQEAFDSIVSGEIEQVSDKKGKKSKKAPQRKSQDLAPAGGPKHFHWVHLAIIGAVAFVLGVVAWNVAKF